MRPEKFDFSNGIPVKVFMRCVEQYPYHWHDALEIVQVLKGSVNISIGDDIIQLNENDIAIINIDELHRITQSADNEILFVEISGDFYRKSLPDNRYFFIYCCSAYYQDRVSPKYEELREHISCLVDAVRGNKLHSGYVLNIENILKEMLVHIIYNFDFLRLGFGTKPFDEKLVERFREIVESLGNHFELNPGLKDLADKLDVSIYHLSHSIKEKFGTSFLNLLYYSKCERAAKLLLGTNNRIIDIALECGFSDPKYLIKHFKQYFNCSPFEFRKIHKLDHDALKSQVKYSELKNF
ncbi:MAG: AraC family transcriptional regulator [Clostridiaceae bacterium]|nr:AraC family transcriptional regulator [Clostridiaceae bacterium]